MGQLSLAACMTKKGMLCLKPLSSEFLPLPFLIPGAHSATHYMLVEQGKRNSREEQDAFL